MLVFVGGKFWRLVELHAIFGGAACHMYLAGHIACTIQIPTFYFLQVRGVHCWQLRSMYEKQGCGRGVSTACHTTPTRRHGLRTLRTHARFARSPQPNCEPTHHVAVAACGEILCRHSILCWRRHDKRPPHHIVSPP